MKIISHFFECWGEEGIERSEISFGMEEIIDGNIENIRQVMNQSAISPEVHYNGNGQVKDRPESQALIRGNSTSSPVGSRESSLAKRKISATR